MEAVRAGWIFAHDAKQYRRWASKQRSTADRSQVGLTGADLERVVMGLAAMHPDLVAVRT